MMRVEETNQRLTQNQVETSGQGSETLAPLLAQPTPSPPLLLGVALKPGSSSSQSVGRYEEWFEWVATVEQALELPLCRLGLLKVESLEGEQHVTPR
jgi:hypothetical protein